MGVEERDREHLRVLVAGGAGFIGSHLCEALLARGHEVICLDSLLSGSPANIAHLAADPRFSLVECDICDGYEPRQRLDRVFNLSDAGSPGRRDADPAHAMLTNVLGTRNLLMLAERDGARFVQASGAEVYGRATESPQNEDYLGNVDCTASRACREEGKRAAEALCFDMLRLRRADVRVARVFDTYGPRMGRRGGIVARFIVQSLTGEPIAVPGSGRQTRSFCYVSDVVRGLIALTELGETPERPVNLGSPQEIEIRDLARRVQLHTGAGRLVYDTRPGDGPDRRQPDISAAERLLGWRPTIQLGEGLDLTVRHFRRALYTQAPFTERGLAAQRTEAPRRLTATTERRHLALSPLWRGTAGEPAC